MTTATTTTTTMAMTTTTTMKILTNESGIRDANSTAVIGRGVNSVAIVGPTTISTLEFTRERSHSPVIGRGVISEPA